MASSISSSADVIEIHGSSIGSTALPTNRSLRSRAATAAPTNAAAPASTAAGSRSSAPVKRPRSPGESSSSLTGGGGGGESGTKRARDAFFDSLVQAGGGTSEGGGRTRVIAGPDDLYRDELRQCFDILHACGQATQKYASLATTRKSIEGFLAAIFNGFDSADEKPPEKPEMSFSVEASAPVGRICGT
jgi:hypothetical protein